MKGMEVAPQWGSWGSANQSSLKAGMKLVAAKSCVFLRDREGHYPA